MPLDNETIEHARLAHEAHVDECRPCQTSGRPCQAAKLLRREYNNLVRRLGR
ncbi:MULTISPECIES: hypothetical protein [Streptomyces]|uniref:Uncharacterized protein n=2 Tax=Streptomyces TaxID=1883 RepID=A0ABV9IPR6_9ACTN